MRDMVDLKRKALLINTAKGVNERSKKYKSQLKECEGNFKKKFLGIF